MADYSDNDIWIEPWGVGGGYGPWFFLPEYGRIVEIHIMTSGALVNSIKFGYEDEEGVTSQSETYGGHGGTLHTITISPEEKIIGISGTFGTSPNNMGITSLSFQIDNEKYGPYGQEEGTSFSLLLDKGKIIGFQGSAGDSLDSIGVIVSR